MADWYDVGKFRQFLARGWMLMSLVIALYNAAILTTVGFPALVERFGSTTGFVLVFIPGLILIAMVLGWVTMMTLWPGEAGIQAVYNPAWMSEMKQWELLGSELDNPSMVALARKWLNGNPPRSVREVEDCST